MADLSIIEKIKLFFETVVSTPFFLIYAILGIVLAIIMIVDIKKHKKISSILYFMVFSFLTTFVLIRYFSVIVNIIDTFIEVIVKALYFPSIGFYITMLLVSNAIFLVLFFSKKAKKSYKIVSGISNMLIDFLFIMIVSIIAKNNIDINLDVKLYSNSTILVLLQLSISLIFSMYILLFFIKIYYKFRLYDKVVTFDNEEYPDMDVYVDNNSVGLGIPNSAVRFIKVLDFSSKSGDKNE